MDIVSKVPSSNPISSTQCCWHFIHRLDPLRWLTCGQSSKRRWRRTPVQTPAACWSTPCLTCLHVEWVLHYRNLTKNPAASWNYLKLKARMIWMRPPWPHSSTLMVPCLQKIGTCRKAEGDFLIPRCPCLRCWCCCLRENWRCHLCAVLWSADMPVYRVHLYTSGRHMFNWKMMMNHWIILNQCAILQEPLIFAPESPWFPV